MIDFDYYYKAIHVLLYYMCLRLCVYNYIVDQYFMLSLQMAQYFEYGHIFID